MAIAAAAIVIGNSVALHWIVTQWYAGGWHAVAAAWLTARK